MADENVFSATPVEQNTAFTIEDLVGEDKKYQHPNDVAKAYVHIEGHAKTLENENASLRARLDALEAANKQPTPPMNDQDGPKGGDNPPRNPGDLNPRVDENDFRSRIRDEVKALNESERAAHNVDTAARKMAEVYGDAQKANEAVRKRAQELGVTIDWLKETAARSPAAFFTTMGITDGGSRSTPAPRNEVNLDRDASGRKKNFDYYDQIRKDNPKLYFSATMQREMQSQAKAQGSEFYTR